MRTNPHGLTFAEWFSRATHDAPPERVEQLRRDGSAFSKLRQAWRRGDAPQEHAAR
jgi:hypothetical protein